MILACMNDCSQYGGEHHLGLYLAADSTFMLQVIAEYDDAELEQVLEVTEMLNAHLTAAVVSNDVQFLGKVSPSTSALLHLSADTYSLKKFEFQGAVRPYRRVSHILKRQTMVL